MTVAEPPVDRRGAAASSARRDRRRARRDPRPARRPRPERPRARDVQRHVERALLVQELASRCCGPCRRPARASSPGRARTPASSRSATGSRSRSRSRSHNHPSAVEPYQGAATGVGGILRDIFTMGARPIAVLDALRFGDPADARTRHLVDGVVRGVGGYGNCVGVPTVGGELVFDPSYEGNPLVNVMAIGLLEERLLTLATAGAPGNLVVLFGSTTGRDGIGGASRARLGRRSPTTTRPSGRSSRSATRSPRSCSSRRASSSSSAVSSRASRTSAPAGSPARPRRSRIAPAPGSASTSTRSRGARRTWSRSRS